MNFVSSEKFREVHLDYQTMLFAPQFIYQTKQARERE